MTIQCLETSVSSLPLSLLRIPFAAVLWPVANVQLSS